MKEEKLLYYPFMSIPNSTWLVQALLYWDGVATIIPIEEQKSLRNVTPFAKSLIQDGLIEAVPPEEYANSAADKYLEFLRWVQSNKEQFLINYRDNNVQRVHVGKLNGVHLGKLDFLGEEFVSLGIAHKRDDTWYEMDEDLSAYFMTFLAGIIGKQTGYIPTTDQNKGLTYLFKEGALKVGADLVNNKFRNCVLEKLLPVPLHLENYYEIYRFKETHQEQLIKFRREIENFLVSLGPYSEEERRRLCDAFCERISEEKEAIKREMSFFRTPQVNLGTVVAMAPAICDLMNSDISLGAVGFIPAIGELFLSKSGDRVLNRPFAYAALYDRRFLRGNHF